MFRSPLPASPHDEPAVSRESQRRRQHGPAARPLMMSSGSPGLGRRIERKYDIMEVVLIG